MREQLRKKRDERREKRTFQPNSILADIKPREHYIFHSDYFDIDDGVASILVYAHSNASIDNFGPFWGINRIPYDMPDGVVTINIQQISCMPKLWVEKHQKTAESASAVTENENVAAGKASGRGRASRRQIDMEDIASHLAKGASYLKVYDRLLVKAPDIETLERAILRLDTLYEDRFSTLTVTPVLGEQRQYLSKLLGCAKTQLGKPEYFTSEEFAGSYGLVTHGLEDPGGEYVGYMVGDVNNSAVLFDVDAYRHHVVIASEQINRYRGRAKVADMWGSLLGQSALCNGKRAVHILLDKCDLDRLGPRFDSITQRIDMNAGDVNMFEMFGRVEDELSIFASQMSKLVLMAEQAFETTPQDRSIIDGALEEIATKFYIDNHMWYDNAGQHRDKLRIVGLDHKAVPRLQMFVSYLDTEYKQATTSGVGDNEQIHALGVLRTTFKNLLSNNGDLFNTYTSASIDKIKGARRVIYDFSDLMVRGRGVAMAQLVNIIDYAVAQLGERDIVIVHAAENIVDDEDRGRCAVRTYVNEQFTKLFNRGGRVAFLYNTMHSMLKDVDFNHFDRADYTLMGNMSENVAQEYQEKLGQKIPNDLIKLITNKSESYMYVRRGFDNVVFQQDLRLDIEG